MRIALLSFLTLFTTCRLDKPNTDSVVARVNDKYLYISEIEAHLGDNLSSADSASVVQNYINTWAKEQLLLDKAVFNLTPAKQTDLEALIRRYRNDLYIKTYQEEWLKARVDTLVEDAEMDAYFKENKQHFKLHQDLMRGRYIKLSSFNFNKPSVSKALRRFNPEDRTYLDSISLQFNNSYLNDSIWLRPQTFFSRINLPTPASYERFLKSNRFFEMEDSLDLYLVFVEEVRRRNEMAPISHVRSTLKQIILNKRKLEMLRQFDRDILNEAVKENIFETYE
ncbi:MAG: peptidyl-prolyl cis-trans isomerase [Bacteroidetes bacterium]|nr:peptidyl-prolyl cis-trans isomerase [Bacteroidota bacterium]MDA0889408.1 peptidyl-prolyl cis-trans isomerase [Bacteroidota bacterium]MDA1085282.1 peptidyl-prolyl cis-trans isomerase [Bacteroidota bacterium]